MKKTLFGINPEEAYEKFLRESKNKKSDSSETNNQANLTVPANIIKQDYVQIPGTSRIISKREIHKGRKWQDSHYDLESNGLFMPTPSLFMHYFMQVRQAADGKLQLYDAANNPISAQETRNLWKYLTSDFEGGAWSWLDAKFILGLGVLGLDIETDHRVIGKDKRLQGKQSPLEACLNQDTFANLDFNSQGLANVISSQQTYIPNENIYFWYPRPNSVAGFGADAGRAGLGCGGDPADSDSGLGVFACAEGTQKSKK